MDDLESQGLFTPETLERYFRAADPTQHRLSESSHCMLLIEPHKRSLRLRTPATGASADVGAYDRIDFDIVEEPGVDGVWFELSIEAEGMVYEAYSLIMSIVDQLEAGRTFQHSVADALATYKELLTRKRGLSDEQEIGLFGELGVFLHLLQTVGGETAIAAWLGPENEEHDFVLPRCDLEVKTTRSEARVHVIGSATQLASSPGRPLYLISVQVTGAGSAAEGESLYERVERVRAVLGRSRVFDDRLRLLGWNEQDAGEIYTRRYLSRSTPRSFLVDEGFPAISLDGIARIVRRPQLVVGLIYRIDVTGLMHGTPPPELVGYCEGNGS